LGSDYQAQWLPWLGHVSDARRVRSATDESSIVTKVLYAEDDHENIFMLKMR
jgi:hypothetical protein